MDNATMMAFNLWIIFEGRALSRDSALIPTPVKNADVTRYRKWYDSRIGSFDDVFRK